MARSLPFSLSLGPDAADANVVVEFEQVALAPVARGPRRARLDSVKPRWFAASVVAVIAGLVVLSLAAGTVSVAPPPAPTPLPGQPTPTAGPAALRVGNLLIQAPVAARSQQAPAADKSGPATVTAAEADAAAVASEPDPTPAENNGGDAGDGGGFRLTLPFFQAPAPPRPTVPPRQAAQATPAPTVTVGTEADDTAPAVVPVPSPAAGPLSGHTSAPRPGSALEDALRTASIANDEFNRGLHEPVPPKPSGD